MRKKIISVMLILMTLFGGIYTYMNNPIKTSPNLLLANIEALANYESGVGDCDIKYYNRNCREAYVYHTVNYDASIGTYVIIGGRKVKLGLSAQVGGSVGIPDCISSNGNCCAKSFISSPPKYY